MARKKNEVEEEILEDEFLDEEQAPTEEFMNEDEFEGQLAVDVYETKEKLVVKGRVAGVNKADLDVSVSDNTLSIRGTLSAGNEDDVERPFTISDDVGMLCLHQGVKYVDLLLE